MKKFIACVILSIAYLVGWCLLRGMFFYEGARDLDTADNIVVLSLGLITVAILALAVAKGKFGKWQRLMLRSALAATLLCFVVQLSFRTSLVRYLVVRYEVMERGLGLSHHKPGTRDELNDELLSHGIGPWIYKDEGLLRKLVLSHGSHFRNRPVEARIAFAGLRNFGIRFEELWEAPEAEEFLLSLLQSEADPEPWFGLDRFPLPEFSPNPEMRFHSGFLSLKQAKKIVDRSRLRENPNWEQLIFFASFFPRIFTESERDFLFTQWKAHFPEDAHLLEDGYRLRDFLKSRVNGQSPVTVAVTMTFEPYMTPIEVRDKQLDQTLQSAFECLVRSCSDQVKLVDSEEADLRIHLVLGLIEAYKFEQPIYEFITIRTPIWKRVGKTTIATTETSMGTKVSGSQTTTKYVASVKAIIERDLNAEQVEHVSLEETMVYWYEFYGAKSRNADASTRQEIDWKEVYDRVSGRMWPLGIHEDYFRYPSVRGNE
ncbi:MAG: hypothetical protein P1U68_07740 [Verrucomicrobiales bacterium]|nr:hypothetical protein [Verrucomicrobiales bacterium]